MLEWSWVAFLATMGWTLCTGFVAVFEGTFSKAGRRHVALPFINHGGLWGDVFLLPFMNALIVPHFHDISLVWTCSIFAGAASLTLAAHHSWGLKPETDFVFPGAGSGLERVRMGGWMHAIFMAAEAALLGFYLISSMPTAVVHIVSLILVIHFTIGTVQPGWYVKRTFKVADLVLVAFLVGVIILSNVMKT